MSGIQQEHNMQYKDERIECTPISERVGGGNNKRYMELGYTSYEERSQKIHEKKTEINRGGRFPRSRLKYFGMLFKCKRRDDNYFHFSKARSGLLRDAGKMQASIYARIAAVNVQIRPSFARLTSQEFTESVETKLPLFLEKP